MCFLEIWNDLNQTHTPDFFGGKTPFLEATHHFLVISDTQILPRKSPPGQ